MRQGHRWGRSACYLQWILRLRFAPRRMTTGNFYAERGEYGGEEGEDESTKLWVQGLNGYRSGFG